jgi:hypothetical protein
MFADSPYSGAPFASLGINPDVNNDEAQAYLLSWIVEEVYKTFK